ncbi:Hypothetical predicted protein [Mytilus galloprovincialis]|uniref:Uncharacterized protein n=1 Tax=Mytilus galloprovincialis TaxID=29158 RepID=A0A8B6HFF8_MYTGA|nr:Hypothetical predicted protein [Mytilus galloprovincialis]
MTSQIPNRSHRKRKSTQRLGELMGNKGSSDLEVDVPIDNPVPSSSNPNANSDQLSAENQHVVTIFYRAFQTQAFRQWREIYPFHLSLDGVNVELLKEALVMGLIEKTNAMKQPFLTDSITAPVHKQKRFCYAFNNDTGCTARMCRYEHTCQVCGGDHSRRDCQQSKSNLTPPIEGGSL